MTQTVENNINYQDLVASLPCGIVVLDKGGVIISLNPCAQQWLGHIEGKLWREIVDNNLHATPQDIDSVQIESGLKLKVQTNALKQGQVIILVDHTLTSLVQDKLNQEKRLQSLGNMCANLAHQIRNPLCAALIHVQNLMKRYPEEAKISKVQKNLKAIDDEVNAILMFSRSDQTLVETLQLQNIIHDAVAVSNIESKEITINLDVQMVEPSQVRGNQQALTGALTNVISNAIEASHTYGQVTIRLTEQGEYYQIDIMDHGTGIEQNRINQIFEPFYTTKAKGTGLGLAIAKQVIQNHHGDMSLTSKEGEGTHVKINLPKV